LTASCYLLFRRGNAFASDIKPPERIRRWTALFFAVYAQQHIWYMPILFVDSEESIIMIDVVGCLLDSLTGFPIAIIVMLVMLQDRRRPLWSVVVITIPIVLANIASVVAHGYVFLTQLHIYFLLMCIGLFVYMLVSLRQYGRWLRDNYADLEHKEVWQSFVVLAFILLLIVFYAFVSEGPLYQYAMQVIGIVLIGYLLWRVETLSDLSLSVNDVEDLNVPDKRGHGISPGGKFSLPQNIGPLLKKYCEDPQLYLQNDVSLSLLANQIGINRTYLSKHFAIQGISYNEYINGLRIQHFINLYHEAAATHQPVTVQQLAYQSGFRSYNTFSVAFKKIMGMNTTEWIRDQISAS
jgi:AraC-like DNA-binding protein